MDLREFIAKRKKEISQEIVKLKREKKDLIKAEKALSPECLSSTKTGAGEIRPGTIKEKIMSVLTDKPKGAESRDILLMVEEKFNTRYSRESLSPQLSRLKKDGYLLLDGNIWRLNQSDKTEAGDADTAPASESKNPDQSEQAHPDVLFRGGGNDGWP